MENTAHNPDQHMFGLRQIATNGKKRIGLLLGAGAPVSINVGSDGQWKPLIPNIAGLEVIVLAQLSTPHREVYGQIKESISNSNLEKILSKIRMLAEVVGTSKIFGYTETEFLDLSTCICNAIRDVVSKELPESPNPYSEVVAWINGINRNGLDPVTQYRRYV